MNLNSLELCFQQYGIQADQPTLSHQVPQCSQLRDASKTVFSEFKTEFHLKMYLMNSNILSRLNCIIKSEIRIGGYTLLISDPLYLTFSIIYQLLETSLCP